jgi:uncharacterized RDD family membrane protein YckC
LLAIPVTFLLAAAGIDVAWFGIPNRRAEGEFAAFSAFSMAALAATALLYYPLMECSRWQGTFAKRRLALRVVDLEGGRISFLRALARHVVRVAPLVAWLASPSRGTFFVLVAVLAASSVGAARGNRRALHDLAMGTRVERRTIRNA